MYEHEQNIKKYKTHAVVFREWKRKTNSEDTAKIVNKMLGVEIVSKFQINDWYRRFENGNTGIFSDPFNLNLYHVQNGVAKTLYNSLFLIGDEENLKSGIFAKNGRFFISEVLNNSSIGVYDLFCGTKRSTPISISFKHTQLNFISADEYLVCLDKLKMGSYKVHLLKINYHTNVSTFPCELDSVDLVDVNDWNYSPIILLDYSNNHRFMIYDSNSFTIGQIQNDKLVMENKVNKGMYLQKVWNEERLIGDKVQYFRSNYKSIAMTFCEIDVNSLKEKSVDASIKLDSEELWFESYRNNDYCWSKDCFYAFYKMKNKQYKLLSFNSNTFKWSDVKLSVKIATNLYIDKNDVLMIKVGGCHAKVNAYYRVAIRTPDTLINLTLMAAVREFNLYGNEKYIRVGREIQLN